ncbi:MAG: S8 family serine peptidase [Bacteroidales bacterium]|nr:S8 family serine peptidase [Bacteroidales bacterium]
MAPNIIFTGELNDYKPTIWSGQELYRYYSQLKNFLSQQIGDEYADLFAEPFVAEGSSKIRWLSEVVGSQAKKISQLPEVEQVAARHKLKSLISKINEFAQDLVNSGQKDAVRWGEIIQNATDVPSMDYIFVENGNVVLVAWGFTTMQSQASDFKLTKEILKDKKVIPPIIPPIEPVKNVVEENKIVDEVKETPVVAPETKKEPVAEKIEDKKEEPKEKKNEKSSILKKWWFWVILVAVILGILYLIFFCCKGDANLPHHEGDIPPIDTTKIVEDPNGRQVISNQLILYIGSQDKTVEQLAEDFKKLYPGNDYKVVYYNTTGAKRINIEFPETEKEAVKQKLKEELTDYNLVIVDEAVFKNEMVPPDPAFADPDKDWSYEAVKVYPAWDVTQGNPDIVVAIIDDGFDLNHPEFQGKIVFPFNVPMGNTKPNTGDVGMFHGTHVASTAIGNMGNSEGLCGIAPNCGFMPIQVGDRNGNMSTTAIIDAIFYAIDNGADVINMSLGMPALPGMANISQEAQEEFIKNTYLDDEELWNQIFMIADQSNVTVVLAGGNDDVLIGVDPMQRYPNTIKVSALNPDITKAEFSNYGTLSTISAPGVEIYSALPNDQFGFLQGTSMASPMVAGGVALIKSQNPNLTNEEVIKILQETGVEVNNGDKYVGNLMQLSEALGAADGCDFNVDCPEIQEQIDELLRQIDSLKALCQGDTNTSLIIPDDPKDFEFAMGKWKSTSDLHNSLTEESVELYFQFNRDGTGEVTFLEADGNKCYSDLTLSLENNSLAFAQNSEALCEDSEKYMIHTFVCSSEDNNVAQCVARTEDGQDLIEFTLERVE